MRSIFRLVLGGKLIEVQVVDNKIGSQLFNVSYGNTHYELTKKEAEERLGRFVFCGLKSEGRFEPPRPPEITVDYDVLKRQVKHLALQPSFDYDDEIDGLFNLLEAILERKPFREVKDK